MVNPGARTASEAWVFDSDKIDRAVFEQFQSGLARAQGHEAKLKGGSAFAEWPETVFLRAKVQECVRIQVCARLQYLAKLKQIVIGNFQEIQKFVGGRGDGSNWNDGLSENPEYQDFYDKAKETLLANAGVATTLPKLRQDLWKDL
jgi:hypothetical protein